MENKKLTDKQQKFIDEYMIDLNATQAAIRAGYSEKTANRIASENLSKVDIMEEISKRRAIASTKAKLTREDLLNDLIAIKDLGIGNTQATLKAIEILLKMQGWNEAEKVEHTGNIPITVIKTIEVKKPNQLND